MKLDLHLILLNTWLDQLITLCGHRSHVVLYLLHSLNTECWKQQENCNTQKKRRKNDTHVHTHIHTHIYTDFYRIAVSLFLVLELEFCDSCIGLHKWCVCTTFVVLAIMYVYVRTRGWVNFCGYRQLFGVLVLFCNCRSISYLRADRNQRYRRKLYTLYLRFNWKIYIKIISKGFSTQNKTFYNWNYRIAILFLFPALLFRLIKLKTYNVAIAILISID